MLQKFKLKTKQLIEVVLQILNKQTCLNKINQENFELIIRKTTKFLNLNLPKFKRNKLKKKVDSLGNL